MQNPFLEGQSLLLGRVLFRLIREHPNHQEHGGTQDSISTMAPQRFVLTKVSLLCYMPMYFQANLGLLFTFFLINLGIRVNLDFGDFTAHKPRNFCRSATDVRLNIWPHCICKEVLSTIKFREKSFYFPSSSVKFFLSPLESIKMFARLENFCPIYLKMC